MTKQVDILEDSNYVPVLDHGFIGLVDHMGSDAAIVQAARVSYGAGTKQTSEDRGLIRYLLRHSHTTPFEMCDIKVHIRAPIFVLRQWMRHRTASVNEESARYSLMSEDHYMPDFSAIQAQSVNNKQGRAGEIDKRSKEGVQWLMNAAYDTNMEIYKALLGPVDGLGPNDYIPYDPYTTDNPLLTSEFPGIARELARVIIPTGAYSELYFKQNLNNMFHLIKLRTDPHAQMEIRAYAQALYGIIQPLFPLACEAFEDYDNKALTLSRMEIDLTRALMASDRPAKSALRTMIAKAGSKKAFAAHWGMTLREINDYAARFDLSVDPQQETMAAVEDFAI